MSDRQSTDALSVTFVTRTHHDLEAALVTSALARVSLMPDKLVWLSKTPDCLAIEATLSGIAPDDRRLEELPYACEQAAQAGIDFAILPATGRKKQLLICDMDSTIIAEECLDELADFAGLKAEISAITERAMAGELNFEEALTTRVGMLKGLPVTAILECYEQRIHLNPGARTLVATMTAHGAECQLVSGGFTDFTSRVAAAAGFTSHHANTLENDGTLLTGKVRHPILGREAKLSQLERAATAQGIDLNASLCMGDGANDLAMIEAAGLGIAYRAKPIVAERANAAINHTDLTTALFFQGYTRAEFVTG